MQERFSHIAAVALISALGGCVSVDPPAVGEAAFTRSADDSGLQWGGCPPIFPAGCGIASLHGDPAKPNADIFLRVPGGVDLPNHTHTSAERIILISGELKVQYRGQNPATLRAGQYAYGPAGRAHTAHCLSQSPCILFIAFEQPVDANAYTETKPQG